MIAVQHRTAKTAYVSWKLLRRAAVQDIQSRLHYSVNGYPCKSTTHLADALEQLPPNTTPSWRSAGRRTPSPTTCQQNRQLLKITAEPQCKVRPPGPPQNNPWHTHPSLPVPNCLPQPLPLPNQPSTQAHPSSPAAPAHPPLPTPPGRGNHPEQHCVLPWGVAAQTTAL